MKMNQLIKKILITIAGTLLVIIGIIGWLLPIVPGFFLIVIGLPMMFILTPWSEKINSFINRILKKNPLRIKKSQTKNKIAEIGESHKSDKGPDHPHIDKFADN
jgi:UPF0716 family protein affecting phage T7 exclusion